MPANTSTKVYPARLNMVKGMNRTLKPALLTDQWRTLFNMRPFFTKLTQVPRKRVFGNFCSIDPAPVLQLATFPTGVNDQAFVVGLTRSASFNIGDEKSISLGNPDEGAIRFAYSNQYERWGTTFYNGEMYFVNSRNAVKRCNGTNVFSVANSPAGRYIEHFFDHLIIGAPTVNGITQSNGIMWSHMHNFSEWTAKTFTEADEMTLGETRNGGENVADGCTGVARLGDNCLIYTPSAIYAIQYVGLKAGIFKYTPLFHNVGNGFPYGLVVTRDAHFFPDLNRKTFYRLDANGPKEIGTPIMEYVTEEINNDPRLGLRLWGYVDYDYREIHWVFCSKHSTTGDFDREVVYNMDTETWYAASVEDVHSFCPSVRKPKTIAELAGTVEDLVGEVNDLSFTNNVIPRLYGTKMNFVLSEETVFDPLSVLMEQETPLLETGDFLYDDIAHIKEVESMVIHAGYASGDGINVYYSARANVDAAVEWILAGVWTPTLVETVLSAPRASGVVFRFKFEPVANGLTTEVALYPQRICAEAVNDLTFKFIVPDDGDDDDGDDDNNEASEFVFICGNDENHAGYWNQFYSAFKPDYKWTFKFVLPADRVLNRLEIYRLNAAYIWQGQCWATDLLIAPNGGPPVFSSFPIVIFEGGQQLFDVYKTSLGNVTKGSHEWILFGDPFSNPAPEEWFQLRIFWADGEEELVASASCNPPPPCPPCPGPDRPPECPPCHGDPPVCVPPVAITVTDTDVTVAGPICPDYEFDPATIPIVTNGTLIAISGSTGGLILGSPTMLPNPGSYAFSATAIHADGCIVTEIFNVELECTDPPCDMEVSATNFDTTVEDSLTCPCYTVDLAAQVTVVGGSITGYTPDLGPSPCLANPGVYNFTAHVVSDTDPECTEDVSFSVTLACTPPPCVVEVTAADLVTQAFTGPDCDCINVDLTGQVMVTDGTLTGFTPDLGNNPCLSSPGVHAFTAYAVQDNNPGCTASADFTVSIECLCPDMLPSTHDVSFTGTLWSNAFQIGTPDCFCPDAEFADECDGFYRVCRSTASDTISQLVRQGCGNYRGTVNVTVCNSSGWDEGSEPTVSAKFVVIYHPDTGNYEVLVGDVSALDENMTSLYDGPIPAAGGITPPEEVCAGLSGGLNAYFVLS